MAAFFNNLTSKQKKVYTVIESYIRLKGIPPTVREIGELVGEKTPGAVQGILNRLEQKGVIRRQLGMARSIQLVSEDEALYANPVYVPEIKKINKRNLDDILNIYNIDKYHPVSTDMLQEGKKYFFMRCPDNSLASRGIRQEEMLLLSLSEECNEGDIVLAVFENHTLLRHVDRCNADEMVLKADFDLFGKESFHKDEIKVIGKLIFKITKF